MDKNKIRMPKKLYNELSFFCQPDFSVQVIFLMPG
jgi:hypothetical protein